MSPGPPKAQAPGFWTTLWPCDVTVPVQSVPPLAMMLFNNVAVSLVPLLMPAATVPLLLAIVTFFSVTAEAPRPEL
jgi:hypothetical protein